MYAGLKNSSLCYCGDTYPTYSASSDTECDTACSGDNNQVCGGAEAISIYRTELPGKYTRNYLLFVAS